mgnify:CR=1 FL=1
MTIREVRALVREWQSLIPGLKDWKISISWGSKPNMLDDHGEILDATCLWQTEHALATILIRRAAPEIEATILHELLHILLEGHTTRRAYSAVFELGLNRLADLLVRFKHSSTVKSE